MTEIDTAKPFIGKSECACIVCGQFNPEQLERHWVAGFGVSLCQRCKQLLIELSAPPFSPIWAPPDNLELIAHALLAEAALLGAMAQSRRIFAHVLIDRVRKEAPDQSGSQ